MGLLSEDIIAKANRINILDIARSQNIDIKRDGKSYHIPGYGGLYISEDGSKWNCFSHNQGGGSIQFYMYITGKNWRSSVIELSGYDERRDSVIQQDLSKTKAEKAVKEELLLPEKAEKYSRLYAYLIYTRKIDKNVVDYFVKEKMLYQEKEYGNVVFVGYDKDKNPKYATMRGTNTYKIFKGDVENSDKSYGFSKEGTTKKVIIFESPIDLMSYITLHKISGNENINHHLLSLGGTADIALKRYLNEHKEIDTIRFCLDNDSSGHRAREAMTNTYAGYQFEYEVYDAKDFNEYLKKEIDTGIKERLQDVTPVYNEDMINDNEIFYEMEM